MYLDAMKKEWSYQIDAPKVNNNLDQLISFCDKFVGKNYYSWSLNGDHYRFFFNQLHHMRAFSDQCTGLSMEASELKPHVVSSPIMPPRAPNGRFVKIAPRASTTFVKKKTPPPQAITIGINGKRTSVTFQHLSPKEVEDLGAELIALCYKREQAKITQWDQEKLVNELIECFCLNDTEDDRVVSLIKYAKRYGRSIDFTIDFHDAVQEVITRTIADQTKLRLGDIKSFLEFVEVDLGVAM